MTKLVEDNLPKGRQGIIDPALLTAREYLDITNPSRKGHPDHAYDVDLKKLNQYTPYPEYTQLINRIQVHGLWFEIKAKKRYHQYIKLDANRDVLRDENNKPLLYTDEETESMGRLVYTYDLAVFNDKNECVAWFTPDEWGCALIQVAREYRNFGFGTLLAKMGYTMYPDHPSGGMTNGGSETFRRVHREFVADALRSGLYRTLLKQGKITMERIREITKSVGLDEKRPTRQEKNLKTDDPREWLLYGQDGAFILYDRKIKEMFHEDSDRWDHFLDDFIKGMIYVQAGEKYGIVFIYGGETQKLRSFLLRCAASYCEREGVTLVLDPEDFGDIDERYMRLDGEPHLKTGWERQEVELTEPPLNYEGMLLDEARFRQSFDRYGEFHSRLVENAESKYRPQH